MAFAEITITSKNYRGPDAHARALLAAVDLTQDQYSLGLNSVAVSDATAIIAPGVVQRVIVAETLATMGYMFNDLATMLASISAGKPWANACRNRIPATTDEAVQWVAPP